MAIPTLTDFDKKEEQTPEVKAITDITLKDVSVAIDRKKSYEEQAEDIAALRATVEAVNDDGTIDVLASLKKSQLIDKQREKVQDAQKNVIKSKTEIQKAERESYEGILETFGFFRHLPSWLTKVIVCMLTPFQILIGFLIGIPCGIIKTLIDNIDGIIVKYERTDEKAKPRIKVTIIILLCLVSLGAVCLTVLACLHII